MCGCVWARVLAFVSVHKSTCGVGVHTWALPCVCGLVSACMYVFFRSFSTVPSYRWLGKNKKNANNSLANKAPVNFILCLNYVPKTFFWGLNHFFTVYGISIILSCRIMRSNALPDATQEEEFTPIPSRSGIKAWYYHTAFHQQLSLIGKATWSHN